MNKKKSNKTNLSPLVINPNHNPVSITIMLMNNDRIADITSHRNKTFFESWKIKHFYCIYICYNIYYTQVDILFCLNNTTAIPKYPSKSNSDYQCIRMSKKLE